MTTEIKNTLFRFVSMRSPELVTDANQKPNFVFQNDKDKGVFNNAVIDIPENSTKQSILKTTAANFEVNVKSAEDLKVLNKELYDFSVWVAKNRYNATDTEINAKAKLVTDTALDLKLIWENLFYQVITQKDFYAKEIAMQLLLAYHIKKATTLGTHKERALAKIVLPKEIFLEDSSSPNTLVNKIIQNEITEVPFASHTLRKLENKAIAEDSNKLLQNLKIELANAETIHKKNYDLDYKEALASHQAKVKPILDAYHKELEDLKKNWCTLQDSTKPFDSTNPCNQPPTLPEPVLPEFIYPYDDTVDEDFLSNVLSQQAFETYSRIVNPINEDISDEPTGILMRTTSAIERLSTSTTSFVSINNSITAITDANNSIIQQNIIDNGSTSVVIGSSVITVPNTISPLLPFQYEIKTRRSSWLSDPTNRRLQISLGIPDSSFKITQVKYKMTRTDGTFIENTSSIVQHFSAYDALDNLSMVGITSDLSELLITFQFENEQITTLSIPNFKLNSIYKDFIQVELIDNTSGGNDSTGGNSSSNENSTISPDDTFIPSGFGMKQIGIADYNKVEQTIQGYIEGEVAHIENVMAREFKEKSTRRLRRSEVTETTSSETEREQLTDTSTVDRFEMQSEVAKVIANSQDFSAGVQSGYNTGKFHLDANANFATHNSKEENTRQAVTNAKEITERALDRIVSKVKEERIEKILEEFEENNTHGFDNRKGDEHVVGVYRWVDKIFKNQIINYGKRLMFEFAIPEPARLHWLAIQSLVDEKTAKAIAKPQDPRTSASNKLENYSDLTDDTLKHWTGIYNVEFKSKPSDIIYIGESINAIHDGTSNGRHEGNSGKVNIDIPEGYETIEATLSYNSSSDNDGTVYSGMMVTLGNKNSVTQATRSIEKNVPTFPLFGFRKSIPMSYTMSNHFHGNINASIKCQLTSEAENQWKQETFNTIIKAYEEALEKYNQTISEETVNGTQILGTNPGFYREIENTVLRKNCISYMISSNKDAKKTFGRDFYQTNDGTTKLDFSNAIIKQNADLDNYASFVKFMEQAFEWDIMSYYFYPFYWGNRNKWTKMYRYEDTQDHIFKAFMQSGMARVIVTVRPGFEEAVRYYMQTGQIWNGGEVPVIGDELYLSIVEEMRKTEGEKVGKAWPTRIPTSMTILQAQSIGLVVDKALPFDTDSLNDFENPDEVPQSTQLDFSYAQIGGANTTGTARLVGKISGNNGINAKIVLRTITGTTQDITYCDANGLWELNNLPEAKYELFLDANNDFPTDSYTVTVGSKELVVDLVNDETVEVNITIESL